MATNRPYYEVIRDLLAANIDSGRLPAGTRLITAAVADRLGVSRPPVKRALARLEQEGRLRHSRETGYVVGAGRDVEPIRLNLHVLDLDLSGPLSPPSPQATWERIFETVESDILNCMPFGTYQISEAGLGDHFSVSRTVIRDVLSRMQDRALISKDRSSHWIAGPLSARMLDDAHAVRRLLEPSALASALPHLDAGLLAQMRERVRQALDNRTAVSQPTIDVLETDLHILCLEPVRNRRLADAARLAQLSLVVNRLFGTYIGVHDESEMLMEHRLVLDHLILGDGAGTETALRYHLDADHQRARARLKVLSVFSAPEIAPYLIRVH
ncbi:GntR family transcriptional regulator [Vineibacter terrae]|uniref:GntR family transcriptional regulator n=1 Tax=Vineibacter terrae TaxID=2586908 RepID=UPI002E364183|nr:GntR family transcriptional regulator [Vineibacter terrae]HEX2886680.1 GntR family transcriptional regulator [Vineibacter terrae]